MPRKPKKPPLLCKGCGKPEQKMFGGLYTNLSPYMQICTDCINRAFAGKPYMSYKGGR